MRENLLKEKHSGGLAGHFGHDKTFAKFASMTGGHFGQDKTFVSRRQKIRGQMQNLLTFEGKEEECRLLSTIANT
jgi:hypothetical protein